MIITFTSRVFLLRINHEAFHLRASAIPTACGGQLFEQHDHGSGYHGIGNHDYGSSITVPYHIGHHLQCTDS